MSRATPRTEVTPATITKVVLPVVYAGTGLRLLALLRERDDPAVREMGIALASAAAAGSTLPPAVLNGIEDLLGDANYGRFFSQLGTVIAAAYGDAVLLRSAYPPDQVGPKVRSRQRRMFSTLLLMSLLFARDRSTAAELQVPSDRLYTRFTATYWLIFAEFIVEAATEVGVLALRTSRLTQETSLRSGLRCVGAGALLMGGFYVQYAAGVAGRLACRHFPAPLRGVPAQAVLGVGTSLIAVGASLPGAMWRVRTLRGQFQDLRQGAALGPVWRHFRRDDPATTLSVGGLASPDVRLFRRVIETLDGLDRLASRRDPRGRVYALAADFARQYGMAGEDVTALQRAALIRYATDYPLEPDSHPGSGQPATPVPLAAASVHADYREEARRLLQTRDYLRSSPLPWMVAQQVRQANTRYERTAGAMAAAGTPDAEDEQDRTDDLVVQCTCLPSDPDSVGYLEYALGRTECEKAIAEERRQCAVHGDATLVS